MDGESFLASPLVVNLQHFKDIVSKQRREAIEHQQAQRNQDLTTNTMITQERLEKELHALIQDKGAIDRRNQHLLHDLQEVKQRAIQNLAKIRKSDEVLTHTKQQVYEHLQKHNPKNGQDFFRMTNLESQKHKEKLDFIEAKGMQVKDKENQLTNLHNENQKLKEELQFQQQQNAFINQYKQSPYVDENLLYNMSGRFGAPVGLGQQGQVQSQAGDTSQSMERRVKEQEKYVYQQYVNSSVDYGDQSRQHADSDYQEPMAQKVPGHGQPFAFGPSDPKPQHILPDDSDEYPQDFEDLE